ncbi:MAG: phosphoesterase PA-phosphatase related protein [Gemmatimonadetes bacterium]|jgi:membrane-associated phospholipid phosphatase|nr:phosphoesterase PA-phosphatase related protein [Gemmatimonadota bacterium]
MTITRIRRSAACLALALLHAGTLTAQTVRDTAQTDTTRRHQLLFTVNDAALAVGFVGLTVVMFPADRSIAQRLKNESSKANQFFDRSSTGFELISTPGAYIVGPALYAFGRYAHHPDVEDLGWHGTEAVVLATGITGVLKGVLGRSRPYVTNDTNPRDFKFGHGFAGEDRASFPSGHTTVAFAAASSVTSEARRIWPGHTWIVAPVMYGGATLVGLSRMYHNKHWASDVVLGAGIGTFSGLKVVRYSHAHPDNFIDRVILKTSIAPDGHGGGALAWTVPLSH